jgi:hypothetical protein
MFGRTIFTRKVIISLEAGLHTPYTLSPMSELDDIQIGNWLMIVSTIKGSSFILQLSIWADVGRFKIITSPDFY